MADRVCFAVLGAGSWGTALALQLSYAGCDVWLWGRNENHIQQMQADRQNHRYLPGVIFPDNLLVTSNLAEALTNCNEVLLATPSHSFEEMIQALKPHYANQGLMAATKGFSSDNRLLHEIVKENFPDSNFAIISGPSFAKEVSQQLPTTVIAASSEEAYAKKLSGYFSHRHFRVYSNTDIIGVEVGGAVKNVLAVAVGISDGMGFGANARSALITRGLNEMMRLGKVLGAKKTTMMGLSGLGDLILTCTDNQSRNRRFGLAIGEGKTIEQARNSINQVVESVHTVNQVHQLAQTHSLEMPITEQIYKVLHQEVTAPEAVDSLFARSLKSE